MANKITITNNNNEVTITPQKGNLATVDDTTTSVRVTQGNTSVVTVNTPGPKGSDRADLILTSPNGTLYKVQCLDDGTLFTSIIA